MADQSNKDKADRLLSKYAAGECTPEEKLQVKGLIHRIGLHCL
ncbi:Uncharacterised protein [Sphingobacterium thalpophilum]|uniref:Uncharacterized protein n=1 Tax=Sphingobacterium thalpophilum TaxID=259 RepID=A0A4U9VPR1_9SPHI|nr:Uncharacterised protein [Sphingobacterium thalpophilum]